MPRGKQHGKPSNRAKAVEHEIAVKGLFDTLESALEDHDGEAARDTIQALMKHKSAAAKECERRLLKPRSQESVFLVDLLRSFTAPKDVPALRRVAKNRSMPDHIRFKAQRLADWETTDTAFQRVKFLDSLRDPVGTLIAVASSEAVIAIDGHDATEEVLSYLLALPAERRLAVVTQMAGALSESFWSLGHALAHVDDPRLQQFVIAHLGTLDPDGGTARVLQRVARTALDRDVRAAAEDAASRLADQPADWPDAEPIPMPEVVAALLSTVDSEGEQIVILSRERVPGWMGYVQMFWDDTTGVRDLYGMSYVPVDVLEDLREEAEIEGQGMVDVTPAVVRGIFQAAVDVSARTGHPLPPMFELWESFIHDEWPIAPDEQIDGAELDDAPYADRADLVAASVELLAHEWMTTWRFSVMDTMRGMSMADPPKGKKLTNAQFEPLIEVLADPHRRHLLRSRLRRQAWVFERAGAERERDLALAVSASLRSVSIIDLVEHPFLRRMTELSVEMTDPLGGAGLGLPGGLGIADLLGGGLGGFPGLGDGWLDDFDPFGDFEDDEEWDEGDEDEGDEDESVIDVDSSRIIEFPKRDDPTS